MMMASLQTQPYALQRGEGQTLQLWGAQAFIKATSEQTGGAFNLFEVACLPGYTTALHIHYAEDVAVYVLAGALEFIVAVVVTVYAGPARLSRTQAKQVPTHWLSGREAIAPA